MQREELEVEWDEECRKQSVFAKCVRRTDGVKCPDCGTDTVWIDDVTDGDTAKKNMICGSHGHSFWFVKSKPCVRCKCEWTDSSKSTKQLRSADEAGTTTVVCLFGCTHRCSS